jgi:hypothetical protein
MAFFFMASLGICERKLMKVSYEASLGVRSRGSLGQLWWRLFFSDNACAKPNPTALDAERKAHLIGHGVVEPA